MPTKPTLRTLVDAAYALTSPQAAAEAPRWDVARCAACGELWDLHDYRTDFTRLVTLGFTGVKARRFFYRRNVGQQSGGMLLDDPKTCARFVPGWALALGLRFVRMRVR